MSAARADRLSELLREDGLDALVVTNIVNVRYLTGFTGTNSVALAGPELRAFYTDFRYEEQAERQVRDFERAAAAATVPAPASGSPRPIRRVGFEDHHLTVAGHHPCATGSMDDIELVAARLVDRLREVKDDGEVRAIRAAADLATEVLQEIVKGDSASHGAGEGDLEPRDLTPGRPAFDTIVAAGPNSALPHATAGDDRSGSDSWWWTWAVCWTATAPTTRTFATGSSRTRRRGCTSSCARRGELSRRAARLVCREVDGWRGG